jgi:hypothetical protein
MPYNAPIWEVSCNFVLYLACYSDYYLPILLIAMFGFEPYLSGHHCAFDAPGLSAFIL